MKGLTMQILIKLVSTLIKVFLPLLSEEIRKFLQEFLKNFYEHAKTTDNPYDDYFAEFLIRLLGFDELLG